MMSSNRVIIISVAILLSIVGIYRPANALSLDDLISQEKLSVVASVNVSESQIVGQPLIIRVEVSTDRWFARGSRVQRLNVPDVVIQTNSIVTINGTKNINGQSWANQLHEITIYPTKVGEYRFPEIEVEISVNTEENGIVSGVLSTEKLFFNITRPDALKGVDEFVVSSDFSIEVEDDFVDDKSYAIGEAVTQTITFTAYDTPAMMLPIFQQPKLSGISIYAQPARVNDKSNRGSLIGTRVESLTYIFEQSGEFYIPEKIYYWWNTQSNELVEVSIPERKWNVSKVGIGRTIGTNSGEGFSIAKIIKIALLAITILGVIFFSIKLISKKWTRLATWWAKFTKREQRTLRNQFIVAVRENRYVSAVQIAYEYSLLLGKQNEIVDLEIYQRLNYLAFSNGQNGLLSKSVSVDEANKLFSILKATEKSIDSDPAKAFPQLNVNIASK